MHFALYGRIEIFCQTITILLGMKKFFVFCVVALLATAACENASAQPRAIGGRAAYGIDVSYQHGLGAGDRMISLDAGYHSYCGVEAVVTHDWINPFGTQFPWEHKGQWNWYLGVGGGVSTCWLSNATIGVAGRVGVEYNFWFPLQLSIDFRPLVGPAFYWAGPGYGGGVVGFDYYTLFSGTTFGLGVRYCFNQN